MRVRLCGAPFVECRGTPNDVNASLRSDKTIGIRSIARLKTHNSPEEAFSCYAAWLQRMGYIRLGLRQFQTPEGTVLVLGKRSRFGMELRGGKSEMGKATKRFVPIKGGGGVI